MINGFTPDIVQLVEKIAGSQVLEYVIKEFSGTSSSSDSKDTNTPAEVVSKPSTPEADPTTAKSDASALGIFKLLGLVLIGVSIVVS